MSQPIRRPASQTVVPAAPREAHPAWRWARAVAVVVIVAGACVWLVGRLTPRVRDLTPDELRIRMEQAVQTDPVLARELPVEEAIQQVNRLEVSQRRELLRGEAARNYVHHLSREDRARFVRETVDRGLQDQLARYHKMNTQERAAFIRETRERQQEMRARLDSLPPEKKERVRQFAHSADFEDLLNEATKAYLSLTTSEERAELRPLFEGALENLQYARDLK